MLKLTERLSAVALLVRENTSLADIGCDHGFLPVYLVINGKINRAVAADVNEGPLNSCRRLIERYGLEDKIRCVLSDGLRAVGENEAQDIAVCGMGGELIAKILEDCPWVKNGSKHFVFNPMTHPEILRKYLYENGFEIGKDMIVKEGGHYYSVFEAVYTGKAQKLPEYCYYLGNISDFGDGEYLNHLITHLENKEKGGAQLSKVISAIKEKLNGNC